MDNLTVESGVHLEQNYVKTTYDNIAEEFSSTRYKKWPKVEAFLHHLPKPTLLLDVGCGNGKYLDSVSPFSVGCDTSQNLLSICKSRGFEVVRCDMTRLPFRQDTFDAIICIAALHHIVTANRRQTCLQDMVDLLSSEDSKLLVQVWAYEQELNRDNPYLRRNNKDEQSSTERKVCLDNQIALPVHKNRTPFQDQDLLVPFNVKREKGGNQEEHLRYYHVFKEKELDSMFDRIKEVKLVDSYYDKGNWCSVAMKVAKK